MRELKVPLSPAPTRVRVGPGAAVGIDEAMIGRLVQAFYARVRADDLLGPIFARFIAADAWPAHEAKIADFWSSVLLMTGRFRGSPMAAHMKIAELRPEHFRRWLGLFGETAQAVWPPDAAALVVARANMIGESLLTGLAVQRGELPGTG